MNTLLLIDDDADWLMVMRRALTRLGFRVLTSINGKDMFEKITRVRPDAILVDIHMHGVSGEDICHELKTDENTHEIPLLMCSSNTNIESVAKDCGADGFIPKGITVNLVKERLMPFLPEKD